MATKIEWTKWHDKEGVRAMGDQRFNPPQPWGPWTRIMGVVARCEGNMDTVVSYDGTGVTWGFMQWTFTSGRLTNLLQYFKSIPAANGQNVFENLFVKGGRQVFENFGFKIDSGKFKDLTGKIIDPNISAQKQLIDDICMGRMQNRISPKDHAISLANVFSIAGKNKEAQFLQIEFAKGELKRSLEVKRSFLGDVGTIANLLKDSWETWLPGLFFNLWQNSPKGAYTLFMNQYQKGSSVESFQNRVWDRMNVTKFANWSYAKPENKSPRIRRIAKGIKEFYGEELPVQTKF